MTREKRSAIQSVRAKAKKGLNVNEITLPKAIVNHFEAIVTWADNKLAATSKKAATSKEAETEDGLYVPAEEGAGELATA